ncbi:hypothetical protein KIN20_020878 [Parelaphostrongylus tenuis]|uniref:Uncharacterized protein n=1 Tax=Parelaphostrongylus tenuis TaxID=148309 RepID=A0AAD5NAA6_PARTN|nr:hypothetical protein KIN20_020878 [Parelaphostrongylus tenuis]
MMRLEPNSVVRTDIPINRAGKSSRLLVLRIGERAASCVLHRQSHFGVTNTKISDRSIEYFICIANGGIHFEKCGEMLRAPPALQVMNDEGKTCILLFGTVRHETLSRNKGQN